MSDSLSGLSLEELWRLYEHDRDGYTAAKTEFVKKYTQLARRGKV